MPREFSPKEAEKHKRLFEEACALVKGELHLDGHAIPGPPDFRTKLKLRRAAALFEQVLKINPENGPATFHLARIRLRFGDKEGCLGYLLRAQALLPQSPGVARESIMVAMQLGQLDRALQIAKDAVTRIPEDGGLFVNFGLALLTSGRAAEAEAAFRKAADLEPANPVTPKLAAAARLVATGATPPLRTVDEVARAIEAL